MDSVQRETPTMGALIQHLQTVGGLNHLAAEASSMHAFLSRQPGSGDHLLPQYCPAWQVSDVQLLRVLLLKSTPLGEAHMAPAGLTVKRWFGMDEAPGSSAAAAAATVKASSSSNQPVLC
ncbi:MAG: hypothetical protein WDW38_000462 [Sanguina aurantia]